MAPSEFCYPSQEFQDVYELSPAIFRQTHDLYESNLNERACAKR